MKKAKGGKVMGKSYFEDIPDKENDTIDPDDQGSQTYKEINEDIKSGQARYEKLYNRDKSDNNTKVGKIMKKATGGAINAKRIANPNMPRQPMQPNLNKPRPFTSPEGPKRGNALKDYLKNQKQGSYTDRGVAFDYDRKTKTYSGGSMGGSYSVPRSVMKQIATGTPGVELKDYYTPKYPREQKPPRPDMSNPRVDLIRPMPPRPGMSDPRVTPPRQPVAPGKLPASSMPNGSSPTGRYPGGIGFVNDSGMGPRPRPIAAMVGKGLSQQSATQEGAMKAARAASLAAKKESGSMVGPFGSRNPNGPRKPMGSPSPMSGGIMAGLNSMLKGPIARKKGGMAKGKK